MTIPYTRNRWMKRPLVVLASASTTILLVLLIRSLVPSRTWNTHHVVVDLAFSPDGHLLASAETTQDRLLQVPGETPKSTNQTRSLTLRKVVDGHIVRSFHGHSDDIWAVSFSPNGELVATGSADHTIRVWRVSDGYLVTTLRQGVPTRTVSFSPDGTLLSASDGSKTTLWDTRTWARGREFSGAITSFSPDGSLIAGLDRYDVKIWQVKDGHLRRTIPADYSESNLSWSPNGQWLAIGSLRDLQIWRVQDGKQIATLKGHTNVIYSITWSSDGELIATGSGATWSLPRGEGDKTVRLWSTRDWQPVKTISAHTEPILALAFSPAGDWLVSGSRDGKIRWWKVA